MTRERFITLVGVVATVSTAALLLVTAAVRDGGLALSALAAVAGLVAVFGFVVLARVVIVVERSRRQR